MNFRTILQAAGKFFLPTSTTNPWTLDNPFGGFSSAAFSGLEANLTDVFADDPPAAGTPASTPTNLGTPLWAFECGGVVQLRPWLQGAANVQSFLWVLLGKQRAISHAIAQNYPVWTFDVKYSAQIQAGSVARSLLSTPTAGGAPTVIGGSWRGIDAVTAGVNRFLSPDPRWDTNADGRASVLTFDSWGYQRCMVFMTTNGISGSAATAQNLEWSAANSG